MDKSKLPKAGLLFLQWHGWWLKEWVRGYSQESRLRMRFFMKTRGANFAAVWVGPIYVAWRMPWLKGPAQQLHPEAFK